MKALANIPAGLYYVYRYHGATDRGDLRTLVVRSDMEFRRKGQGRDPGSVSVELPSVI